MPIAVCTSSGRVGHSTSFGKADSVTVLARNGALADAVATALTNRIQSPEDIERAIEAARNIIGILGVVATIDGSIGAWGNVKLVALDDEPVAGPFLGSDVWRRVSEVWEPPDAEDVDAAIEVAARLADYVVTLEPLRRGT